ncbi:MAG TPA: hypothetical protein VK070_11455 [Acidimicrobiia bacterium]|jgi:hypothetical protein|nr:hypothetical protein [Acidimicrobiia bacterium]
MTAIVTDRVAPEQATTLKKSWLLLTAAVLALTVGFGAIAGGVFGAWYTWDQAAAQKIVTPEDAAIPETAVRGPFTMWAQADIITHHQLDRTGGLYYSEMERMVPAVDENGQPVLDESGEQVMVPNEARASWLDATTLTTALSVGILSYALSAMAVAIGLTLVFIGFVFLRIRNKAVLL